MKNTGRIILYSSSAIVILVLLWGFRQIPQQGGLADQALRESLNQEMVVLTGAVKASTQSLKFRLLDILKTDGGEHVTRAFQDSPFVAAALVEWDQVQWKSNWFQQKTKNTFQDSQLKSWMRDWPLSKLTVDEVYFGKVGEIQGQPYFAMLVPVRRAGGTPMVGVGIFPAGQFGMTFSAEENREMRVFTQEGTALAISHPAYLGSSLKTEPLVRELFNSDEVSIRHEWKSERGPMIGLAERIGDSNLYAAIETRAQTAASFPAWIYLLVSAFGAGLLNWVLFKGMFTTVMGQLEQSESVNESLRRQLSARTREPMRFEIEPIPPEVMRIPIPEVETAVTVEEQTPASAAILQAELPRLEFNENEPTRIEQVIGASLRALEGKLNERSIQVMKFDLGGLTINGDALQLQTAVEEVLKNAMEAMENGLKRELTINGRKDESGVHITIQDSGRGIAEAELKKVFDPFYSTKESQGPVRGLGLNVVRRVIKEMQGRVEVFSTQGESGHGTRVEITFPVGEAVVPQIEISAENLEERPGLKQPDVIRKPKVRNLD